MAAQIKYTAAHHLAFESVGSTVDPAVTGARHSVDLQGLAKPGSRLECPEPAEQIFLLPGPIARGLLIWRQSQG